MVLSQMIRKPADTTSSRAKPGTKIQPYMINKPHDMSPQTISCYSEVHASKEVGSMSVACRNERTKP